MDPKEITAETARVRVGEHLDAYVENGVKVTLVMGREPGSVAETERVVEVEVNGIPLYLHLDLPPGVPVSATGEVLEIIKATGWRPGNGASS